MVGWFDTLGMIYTLLYRTILLINIALVIPFDFDFGPGLGLGLRTLCHILVVVSTTDDLLHIGTEHDGLQIRLDTAHQHQWANNLTCSYWAV